MYHLLIVILYDMVSKNLLKVFRTVRLLSGLKRRRKRIEALKKKMMMNENEN